MGERKRRQGLHEEIQLWHAFAARARNGQCAWGSGARNAESDGRPRDERGFEQQMALREGPQQFSRRKECLFVRNSRSSIGGSSMKWSA